MNISRLGSVPTPAATPTQTEEGARPEGQRIAKFVGAIEKRVQNASEAGSLSTEQLQALKEAAARFSKLMTRIDNADLENSPKRQVHFALQQLGQSVQDILDPGAKDATSPGIDTTA